MEIQKILAHSKSNSVIRKISVFDSLNSTNTYIKENFQDMPDGQLIIANSQTNGYGRFQRTFYSPENTGIYMSLLLKPNFSLKLLPLITPLAAVCVASAVEKICGVTAYIKWVNDIIVNKRKVCGILTETKLQGSQINLILGIGINLFKPESDFHDEIKDIAGSVVEGDNYSTMQGLKEGLKERLIAEVFNTFSLYYQNIEDRAFVDEYRKRCFVIGKEITVVNDGVEKKATVSAVNSDCNLEVVYKDGKPDIIGTGEILIDNSEAI